MWLFRAHAHPSAVTRLVCCASPQMVELRNGETYNGNLHDIDFLMNIIIKEVICTSRVLIILVFVARGVPATRTDACISCPWLQDGDKFTRIPEVYIRGNTVKYFRIPEEVIDLVQEDVSACTCLSRCTPVRWRRWLF